MINFMCNPSLTFCVLPNRIRAPCKSHASFREVNATHIMLSILYPLCTGLSDWFPVQPKVSKEALHLGRVGTGSGTASGQ